MGRHTLSVEGTASISTRKIIQVYSHSHSYTQQELKTKPKVKKKKEITHEKYLENAISST